MSQRIEIFFLLILNLEEAKRQCTVEISYVVNLSLCACSECNDKPVAIVGDPALLSAFASELLSFQIFVILNRSL